MEKDEMNLYDIDSEKLYEHFSFKVDLGQNPLRVDKFLMLRVENVTRNKIQKAALNGSIRVNNLPVKSSYKVKGGEEVKVLFNRPPHENLLIPEKMDIDIVYEDDDLIVVNKPPNIVVHPGHGNYSGTLINGLLYHFKKLPKNSNNRPGLVHRIDKDTSGLLVIAKTEQAMIYLSKQFYEKKSKRKYIALVWGDLKSEEGKIEGSIGRNPKNRLQMKVFEDDSKGKTAITHYKVLERFGYVTLIECKLETGRTHQIRTHMKFFGHTIFNDERYGGNKILKGTIFSKYKKFVENCFLIMPRQGLHAKSLGFTHPTSKKSIEFNSPIPEDMKSVIDKWRNYAIHKKLN
tara:strand:+ start:2211 stop:3248 length:1038 start_codon:yes stop_codon:yes gene_type:complete